jgi:septum formation protein
VKPSLVLASESEARKRLLKRAGFSFKTFPSNLDEDAVKNRISNPRKLVKTLARLKAETVQSIPRFENAVVIGSDQAVVFENEIYGKPMTVSRAEKQLAKFSGKTIRLLTAVCVLDEKGRAHEFVDVTRMRFRKLSSREIREYVRKDRPLHCAGSFKFEQAGIQLFASLATSDPAAIEGLPILRLATLLRGSILRGV